MVEHTREETKRHDVLPHLARLTDSLCVVKCNDGYQQDCKVAAYTFYGVSLHSTESDQW